MKKTLLTFLLLSFFLSSCGAYRLRNIFEDRQKIEQQIEGVQVKIYDNVSRQKAFSSSIITLQKLGFIIEKTNFDLGNISTSKLDDYNVKADVKIIEQSENSFKISLILKYIASEIMDVKPYETFHKSLSLELN